MWFIVKVITVIVIVLFQLSLTLPGHTCTVFLMSLTGGLSRTQPPLIAAVLLALSVSPANIILHPKFMGLTAFNSTS